MYHPLVYMTTECRNFRNKCCTNRTCAFYHSEAQHQEAKENREKLLQDIQETERKEKEAMEKRTEAALKVDLDSSNQFPSLPDAGATSKSNKKTKRSYAETAKSGVSSSIKSLSQELETDNDIDNIIQSDNDQNDEDQLINESSIGNQQEQSSSPLLSSLNEASPVFSPLNSSGIGSPSFSAVAPHSSVFTTNGSANFTGSIGANEFSFTTNEATQNPFPFSSSTFSFDPPPATAETSPFLDASIFRGYNFKEPLPFSLQGSQFSHVVDPFSSDGYDEISDSLKIFRSKISMSYQGVHEGILLENGEENRVAVKEIDLTHIPMHRDQVVDNLRQLSSLHHPNIIPYRSVIQSNERIYIVTNYFDNSLSFSSYVSKNHDKLLDSNGELTLLCKNFILQLCSILSYFHQHKILHQNLDVSNNILEHKKYVNTKKDL